MSSQNTVQKPSIQSKSPLRKRSQSRIELKKQQQLVNAISIDGIPERDGEDVRALFLQLCKTIDFDVSQRAMNGVYRDTNGEKSIVADLKTWTQKSNMFRAWRKAALSSATFLGKQLSSTAQPNRIHIDDEKTQYYAMLYKMAQNAANDRIFESCQICVDGLKIIYDYGQKTTVVLSVSELDRLIDRYSK